MSRRSASPGLLLLAVVLAATPLCFAAGQPVLLQSELRQPDKIWVGQRLAMNVTLFTTTSFAGVPRFDLPKDAGLAILADDAHPLLGTKTIDGVSYISKQYAISVFPLRFGTLTLPAFPVEFGYQGDAGQESDATLSTTAAQITVLAVPGADAQLPLVTATEFKVDDRWTPNPDKAAVGDAFTRTIALRATGVPGMALPPLKMQARDGLAVYAGQPQVATDTARGDFIGKRVETFSLVCQKAGTYTLPELRIQWWNPTDEQLQVVRLQSRTLQVSSNPVLDPTTPAGAANIFGTRSFWLWAGIFGVGAAVFVVLLVRRRTHQYVLGSTKTEKKLFQQFKQAAVSNDPAKTMQSLIRWLDAAGGRNNSCSVLEFVKQYGTEELERQLAALESCLYGKEKESWSGGVIYKQVSAARGKYICRRAASSKDSQMLGPLNL
jgi:hypothetical protein